METTTTQKPGSTKSLKILIIILIVLCIGMLASSIIANVQVKYLTYKVESMEFDVKQGFGHIDRYLSPGDVGKDDVIPDNLRKIRGSLTEIKRKLGIYTGYEVVYK